MLTTASNPSPWYTDRNTVRLVIRLVGYPLAFAVSAISTWWYKRKATIAESWPTVEGSVQFARVEAINDNGGFNVTLQYSYFMQEYRSGEYNQTFASEDAANDFAHAMKDKKVLIHYDLKDPDKSLLEEEDVKATTSAISPLNLNPQQ